MVNTGDPEQGAVVEVTMCPILSTIHADYIMRDHLTLWFGPSAKYPSGWCKCVRFAEEGVEVRFFSWRTIFEPNLISVVNMEDCSHRYTSNVCRCNSPKHMLQSFASVHSKAHGKEPIGTKPCLCMFHYQLRTVKECNVEDAER